MITTYMSKKKENNRVYIFFRLDMIVIDDKSSCGIIQEELFQGQELIVLRFLKMYEESDANFKVYI